MSGSVEFQYQLGLKFIKFKIRKNSNIIKTLKFKIRKNSNIIKTLQY